MISSHNDILSTLYEQPSKTAKRVIAISSIISSLVLLLLFSLVLHRFYITGQLDARYWYFFAKGTTWLFLLKGFLGTIMSSLLSLVIAFVFGFALMNARISSNRIFSALSTAIIEFTRGVPTLLFIYFFFLVVPQFNIKLTPLLKIALPVSISACGVVAEVLRSGVNAVPKGQSESALSLGLSLVQTRVNIVFPQAFRYVLPSLISELVIVVKDTTFSYLVNYPDLMQNARVLISNYDSMLAVYLLVALVYILLNYGLNKISEKIAKSKRRK